MLYMNIFIFPIPTFLCMHSLRSDVVTEFAMFHFIHPFTAIVAGPSGCGKSNFVTNFLKNVKEICNEGFSEIIWCYDEMQPLYNMDNVHYYQGIPDLNMFDGKSPRLLIIDDLMRESDGRIVDIFTKGSHHRNLSVFYITQNLFHQGRGQRDISLNSSYIIYFKNPRDRTQIRYLARQVSPHNTKFVEEAYGDATSEAHGYLMIDLKQDTNDVYRFKTKIFPSDQNCMIYVSKKTYKYTPSTYEVSVRYK